MEKRMLKEADLYDKSQAHLEDEDKQHNLISSLKASKRSMSIKSTNVKSGNIKFFQTAQLSDNLDFLKQHPRRNSITLKISQPKSCDLNIFFAAAQKEKMRTQAQKNANNNDEKPAIYELIEDTWREEKFENNMLFPSAILYREYLKEKREREEILKVQQEAAQK